MASSWSASGRLLASGSDDTYLNIHTYQPEDSTLPFKLKITVSTGHNANIFSTKFMPHSNDTTLVTCAGDGEVRVFDIERTGSTSSESSVRGQRFDNRYQGVKYYSQNNTNGRVYRSHGDRVKRVITESSPHLFLTCSEDGEVRQFDLRLPSSAYPAPRGSRGFSRVSGGTGCVPPPLISYKKYGLDLNTISCSPSQPHYLALGGAHLHCLLHDRRMIGRNLADEQGRPGSAISASHLSPNDEESMGQATRCVRKFAPNGQKSARKTHNPHITACKISDENPNEMVVSWSGDHVYSFNLLGEQANLQNTEDSGSATNAKERSVTDKDSSHKRRKASSSTSLEDMEKRRAKARLRGYEASSLQVQYENGHSEQVGLDVLAANAPVLPARPQVWLDSSHQSRKIARGMTRIRKLMFSLDICSATMTAKMIFEEAADLTQGMLPEMNEICRLWRYPVDPSEEEARLQRTMRANRDAARSFVQALGTLAANLQNQFTSSTRGNSPPLDRIGSPPNCGPQLFPDHTFSLDFIKAICLWLKGGRPALLDGFKALPGQSSGHRLPIHPQADESGLDDYLIPYLVQCARPRSIPNIEASRFERDETRILFDSEEAAVLAFSHAILMPLEDLSREVLSNQGSHGERDLPGAQDRRTATIFWGRKVARGLLLRAGEGLDYEVVSMAFGGLGNDSTDSDEGRNQSDIDPDAMEDVVESVRVRNGDAGSMPESYNPSQVERDSMILWEGIEGLAPSGITEGSDEGVSGDEDVDGEGNDVQSGEDDDPYENLLPNTSTRGKLREAVEQGVHCSAHIREYRGHCNVKTVKDVNFFGLQDEYVVSGSDSGHLFIWDKKSGEVVNILEGDSQVVNVIQGMTIQSINFFTVCAYGSSLCRSTQADPRTT